MCKLKKVIYGLKQEPCAWFETLSVALSSMGCLWSQVDFSLFYKLTSTLVVYLLVYVDDIIITGNDKVDIQFILSILNNKFSLKYMGMLNHFLGIEVNTLEMVICC